MHADACDSTMSAEPQVFHSLGMGQQKQTNMRESMVVPAAPFFLQHVVRNEALLDAFRSLGCFLPGLIRNGGLGHAFLSKM